MARIMSNWYRNRSSIADVLRLEQQKLMQKKDPPYSVVEGDAEAGTVAAAVVTQAQVPELVQETTNVGPTGADHLRQGLRLTCGNYRLRLACSAKVEVGVWEQVGAGRSLWPSFDSVSIRS